MSKIALASNVDGTGTFTIASPNSNSDRTLTLPDAAGTIVVSGTTPSLSGITFPASQVPSANANTLDDYEEGTWTPTDGSGAGLTFSGVSGNYVKLGNLVIAQCAFTYPVTSSSSQARMNGLPFVTATNGGGFCMYNNAGVGIVLRNETATTNTFFTNVTSPSTGVANSTLTGAAVQITFIYQT
jgi:hypothetical protein